MQSKYHYCYHHFLYHHNHNYNHYHIVICIIIVCFTFIIQFSSIIYFSFIVYITLVWAAIVPRYLLSVSFYWFYFHRFTFAILISFYRCCGINSTTVFGWSAGCSIRGGVCVVIPIGECDGDKWAFSRWRLFGRQVMALVTGNFLCHQDMATVTLIFIGCLIIASITLKFSSKFPSYLHWPLLSYARSCSFHHSLGAL